MLSCLASDTIQRTLSVVIVVSALALAGCATDLKGFQRVDSRDKWPGRDDRILLMPPEVLLAEVTASGMEEPRVDWTREGTENLLSALKQEMGPAGERLQPYESPADDIMQIRPEHQQLVKLHNEVGRSILVYHYASRTRLPTKAENFDWTIGPGARRIRNDFGTDYALFVFFKDTQASAENVAVRTLGFLFTGVVIGRGGYEVGFASLVDLDDGDIVWFNRTSGTGMNLRREHDAQAVARQLLEGLPVCTKTGDVC